MRARSYAVAALLAVLVARNSAAEEPAPVPKTEPKAERKLESVHVELTGVEEAKVVAVEKALAAVDGVASVAWVVAGAEAKVVRESGKASDDDLLRVAKDAGAKTAATIALTTTKFVFAKKLHCAGCAGLVDRALRAKKGVKDVSVGSDKSAVSVVYDARAVTSNDLELVLAEIKRPATAEKAG